ncbi:MAG: signal recognition particle-docking protein FtsY [Alphaproteobacteria bacterium]|nr:signal recognition particle-docking protein FtsY [Alphaproteobacteria bacterium]
MAPYAFGALGVALLVGAAGVWLLGPKRAIAPRPAVHEPAPRIEAATPSGAPPIEEDTVPGAAPRSSGPDLVKHRVGTAPLDGTLQPDVEPVAPVGLVARLRQALGRSREALQGRFDALFGKPIDEALFQELEDTLLLADVGVQTAGRITDKLRALARSGTDADGLREALRSEMAAILHAVDNRFASPVADQPLVVLVVGVNGSGKTTTIGKLASRFAREGHAVLLAAADTYRAAAVDQLKVWAERSGADFVSHDEGADPGAVVYDALEAAKARGRDVVIIDTAGRLQTRKPLMEQLSKLRRVIQKHIPDGPHETLLVLDGTMGQNGLSQAKLFNEATPLSGVVVTKLDGTAKGGMVLTIAAELGLPVKFIGIGEGVDDLRPFEPAAFVEALA